QGPEKQIVPDSRVQPACDSREKIRLVSGDESGCCPRGLLENFQHPGIAPADQSVAESCDDSASDMEKQSMTESTDDFQIATEDHDLLQKDPEQDKNVSRYPKRKAKRARTSKEYDPDKISKQLGVQREVRPKRVRQKIYYCCPLNESEHEHFSVSHNMILTSGSHICVRCQLKISSVKYF
ncbi:unnamed protein product, partial [Allacma fusca]